ncbi:MAG: 3-hydroxyacyl-CoA dehydrogenase/enoyl-CoA hydratase family protein [Bacteroidia bacterium]
MKTIHTVGVVGAGTMGAAIAQKFAQEGFTVILADRAMNYVQKGLSTIRAMLDEGVDRKVFTVADANRILGNITGTDNLRSLFPCDIVVEAIFENFDAKAALFKELNDIVSEECIIASNTSSYSIHELSAAVTSPSRFVGLHFFYHAAKNRLVEVIPGSKTSQRVFESVMEFARRAGKDPITCKDKYGFAVNRYFVPWLNEAVRLYEENVAGKEVIDEVCCKVFGVGMGPFALMNATGVPVAYHSEKTLEVFGKLYYVAEFLQTQALSGKPWDMRIPEHTTVNEAAEAKIRERMLGVVFFVCSQMFEQEVCSATDMNRGARIGLQWKRGPVEMMKTMGADEVRRMVAFISDRYQMKMPEAIGEYYWKIAAVNLTIRGNKAIITMSDPENMNALSVETVKQLADSFTQANNDSNVKTIFITGTGKAFVAGADIRFFIRNIKNKKIADIESFTAFGQALFNQIDHSEKLIIAVVNGLALGGGLELALCADRILALPKAQFAFPETGIGIYPGLGGTQRSVRKIGKGLSKYLVLTGKMLNAYEAEELGIVDKIITMEEMFSLFKDEGPKMKFPLKENAKRWTGIGHFFEKNSLEKILGNKYTADEITDSEAEKLSTTLKNKAPIALKFADQLIDEARGCSSELEHLKEIFSTSDALLGLSSIGKKVQFAGK